MKTSTNLIIINPFVAAQEKIINGQLVKLNKSMICQAVVYDSDCDGDDYKVIDPIRGTTVVRGWAYGLCGNGPCCITK